MHRLLKVTLFALGMGVMFIGSHAFADSSAKSKGGTKSSVELIEGSEAIKLIGQKNVVFVSGDSPDTYEASGHIKGSVEMYAHHLHHADELGHMHCAPLFMCPPEAEAYIASKGISNDTLIIAYDDFRGPNATGVWAYFKSFGHKNIKILNGGMAAIRKADANQIKIDELKATFKAKKDELKAKKDDVALKDEVASLKTQIDQLEPLLMIQRGKEVEQPKGNYAISMANIDWDLIASKEDVVKAMEDIQLNKEKSKYVIVDTRGITELFGEKKLDNVARGGHVPGAKFLEWKEVSDDVNKLSFKDKKEMQKVFEKYGITKDKTIYAYCHVGAGRSTEIIAALRMLGYTNTKVYTGSWDEWGNDMNLPIAK